MDNENICSELYFLIAKFLKNSPCKDSFKKLLDELEEHDLLPSRYDWAGEKHKQSFQELENSLKHIKDSQLLDICNRIFPLLNSEFKRSIKYEPSLVTDGNCSVLRTKETERRSFPLRSYLVRRHGIPLLEPITFRKHHIVKALYGRETSGPFNRKHMMAGCLFKNIQQLGLTQGHLSAVYCVLFDSSGRYIFTGADDLLVKVWHAISGRLLTTLRGASAEITDLAVNYENTLLAAGSVDKIVRVWCLQTAFPVATLVIHTGMITGVNFCPAIVNGCRYLASTATDGSVAFWKYATNDTETSFERTPVQYLERMRPGCAQILCGSFSPGGMFLATGSADHNVRVYKMAGLEGPTRVLEEEAHSDRVDSIQWAHTHLRFASGSKDGTCLIWYFEQQLWKSITLSMTTKLPGSKVTEDEAKLKLRVTMLNWDKSDQWVITASSDHSIKVWNSFTGDLIQVLNGHKDETYVVESHPLDSKILLSAGHDGKLFLWNIITGEILASFQNTIDGQGCGAVFDAKWSPDGSMFAATDSHGRILTFGFGEPDVIRKVPLALFFHTDYRPLVRDLNNVVLDEQTQMPPHLMPPPFLVDMDGNPYPPYLQRLVPGREHCDIDQLVPNVVLSDEGQQEVIMEASENEFLMGGELGESRRLNSGLRSRVGMRRTGDIEGVRQSSGNWQRGDNISWTKRLICEPLDKYRVNEISQRIQYMASIETEEYKREAKKPMAPEPKLVPVPKRVPRRKKTHHSYRTRASRTEQLEIEFENADLSSGDSQDENDLTARESTLDSSSSSTENDASSDYSDWTADHGMNKLEPPKRVARVRNIRKATKITKIVGTTLKKPVPVDIPEEYRPSEWLSETMPKKAPYYPQMGDEVMFFQQGYNLYLNAVQNKNIYKVRPAQLNPWGKIKLKEPQLCKVIGIKYEIRPPRLCGLRLAVMTDDSQLTKHSFDLKYHDITDVIDFLVLRQLYDSAMSRNWKVGDRFRSAIDDAWWCGKIVARNKNAQSPFLCYHIRWDNNEDENLSPWDLEPLNSRKPQNGLSLPILPREMKNILYQPEPDEWPGGDQDSACERILRGLELLMSMAIAEHFLAPVDISIYPSYAYVVEYPIDLSTIKARFENRFYRRLAAAQFDARYIASNAETFNEKGSIIVKHARIITDILLKIIKATLPLDVPALCRQLQENYVSTDSTEEEAPNSPGPSNRLRIRPPTSKRNLRLTRGRRARTLRQPFDWKQKCKELLQLLWMSEDSEPFRQPVDRIDHPDYDKIIVTPMDLSIIREELKCDNYDSPHEFWKDLKIMFNNAKNYTPNKRTRIYAMTVRLSGLAEEQMRTILSNYRSGSNNTTKKTDSSQEQGPRRGLKRRRRAKDSSVEEESSDADINQPSTSTASNAINRRSRRICSEKDSPRKVTNTNTRSPRKIKSPVSSDSEDNKPLVKVASRNQRCRTLRARKTWNYAKMLESQSENSNDSDEKQEEELRPRRQRRKPELVASDNLLIPPVHRLRRSLQARQYAENTDSSEEEDDDEGVNIRVSVSSRGRIRRLTAKARASVFRD